MCCVVPPCIYFSLSSFYVGGPKVTETERWAVERRAGTVWRSLAQRSAVPADSEVWASGLAFRRSTMSWWEVPSATDRAVWPFWGKTDRISNTLQWLLWARRWRCCVGLRVSRHQESSAQRPCPDAVYWQSFLNPTVIFSEIIEDSSLGLFCMMLMKENTRKTHKIWNINEKMPSFCIVAFYKTHLHRQYYKVKIGVRHCEQYVNESVDGYLPRSTHLCNHCPITWSI